ncbi:putative (-)-alpha-pinene synthase [Rosa chinensis]|uniref:Putative (-)-alpha-pinene synthase n=1 Tax=Rosa chinensis TaxID=74649 RepID=A0A2P6RG21_ROSCH|nr:putative (-)-alpha-pinene synthase [Rosa chinensis]
MSSMPIISASFQVPQIAKLEIVRWTANFPPSIWGDRFINYDSQHTQKTDAFWPQQVEKLKTVVKREVFTNECDFSHRLKFIDAIQRLGVAYQFEHETEESLQHIHAKYCHHDQFRDDNHLYNVALCFRLLSQHVYHISSVAFTWCTVCEIFSNNNVSYPALLTEQITEALKRSLRKSLERLCAKCYMSIYQDEASHSESLKLAKLDFNLVQWWRELDFETKLPFARDMVVELFFWIVGVYFEPQYSTGRIVMTKVAVLLTILDDIYDAYGTFEELVIFTKAIDRWDLKCIDELPDYMKIFYYELLNLFNEIDEVISKEGRSHRVSYAIQAAQWLHEGLIPSMEEYIRVATVSISYTCLTTISLLGMEDIVKTIYMLTTYAHNHKRDQGLPSAITGMDSILCCNHEH